MTWYSKAQAERDRSKRSKNGVNFGRYDSKEEAQTAKKRKRIIIAAEVKLAL